MNREYLANLIFPEISGSIADLEKMYPPRQLKEGAEVTRFAPSPTGFLHTGSLFTAMIAKKIATQTGGVFYVRLEDTDTKREVVGAGESLLKEMGIFGVAPEEGYLGEQEVGAYGPYKQSERALLYKTVIKQMIKDNLAYPCFSTPEELNALRLTQEASKVVPGYYGVYAKSSFLTAEEASQKIKSGIPYVIRFRSSGNHEQKIKFKDEVKGEIEIAQNDQHVVILKSDGLPTYHFAHVCDDHFMHTSLVTRGEEWISSVPLHLDLFNALNFRTPKYGHLPVINKLDNGNKRKLSKRKDSEAAVTFFLDLGYPVEALLTYLMSIANSNFEEWWAVNKAAPLSDFLFSLNKMSLDGALFDMEKVNFFAREYIAGLTAKEVYYAYVKYLEYINNADILALIKENEITVSAILNIEREGPKPRKDYSHYGQIFDSIRFFFPFYYDKMIVNNEQEAINETLSPDIILNLINDFRTDLVYGQGNEIWFASLKEVAIKNGFAANGKEYKANPTSFKGMVSDVAELLRICVVLSKKSPNLYEVLMILGREEVNRRLKLMQNRILS